MNPGRQPGVCGGRDKPHPAGVRGGRDKPTKDACKGEGSVRVRVREGS
jgi:hypothetical protein